MIGLLSKQIRKSVSREQGFTLTELMIVVLIMGVMLGAVVIAYVTTLGNSDARSASEMLKQDLRRVYALADSGEKPSGVDFRYQYSITFNGNGDSPPNSYVIKQGTPTIAGSYSWAEMTPDPNTSSKVVNVSGVDYIQPGSNASTTINYGSNRTIYFVSIGAYTLANTDGGPNPGQDMTVKVSNGSTVRTITVSGYGNISD